MLLRSTLLVLLSALVSACGREPDPFQYQPPLPTRAIPAPDISSTRPILGVPTPSSDPVYRVPDGVTEPVEIRHVTPVIPADCRGASFSGIFIFEAIIDRDGTVRDIRTIRRPDFDPPCPHMENAYRRAIAQCRYQPGTLNGKPVPVYLTVTGLLHSR